MFLIMNIFMYFFLICSLYSSFSRFLVYFLYFMI